MSKREIDDTIVTAYLETLLWSETLSLPDGMKSVTIEGDDYEDGTPLDQIPGCDVSDLDVLSPDTVKQAKEDLEGFQSYCLDTIGIDPFTFFDPCHVAYDFALSRNGHGAGFFDDSYTIIGAAPVCKDLRSPGDPGRIEINDELQSAAETFGTHGLSVWVDEESGELKLESHS